jgi:hypothetical protein
LERSLGAQYLMDILQYSSPLPTCPVGGRPLVEGTTLALVVFHNLIITALLAHPATGGRLPAKQRNLQFQ